MTEDEARQVLLLQARESSADHLDPGASTWTAEDRSWATRQAVSAVGEQATPERLVLARTALALQRLLPKDAAARAWLQRRVWHPAWAVLAAVLGLVAGLAVDQLGPPQRVNLLAPAVWAVVAWNALVYLALVLPSPWRGLRGWLAQRFQRGDEAVSGLWARHAAPLTLNRLALVLHLAAAALAVGLMAGLYLRGLVLDYRAGWQSTFLDASAVQAALNLLLAPAQWLTGIHVPEVAPLRLGPGIDAQASAAPWIHLLAATLAWAVVLPRLLLAGLAARRAQGLARRFPLPLDTPYFEALHPLMRPERSPQVRLLWWAHPQAPAVQLFGVPVSSAGVASNSQGGDLADGQAGTAASPWTALVRSEEGDQLLLRTLPAEVCSLRQLVVLQDTPATAPSWWQRLLNMTATPASPLQPLREQTDAVLLLLAPGQATPDWVADLARPALVLVDSPEAEPPRLSVQGRHQGWLAEDRLFQALQDALPGDARVVRLRQAWQAQQLARLNAGTQLLADSLGRIAAAHQPVADEGFLARRAEAEAARTALALALEAQWRSNGEQLADWLGQTAAIDAAGPPATPASQLKGRLGEGRAAMLGGVVTGALTGLKADLLSGGLTLGAGMVAGGVLGALGAAGMAKGLNVVRGTDRSFASWDEEALGPITAGLLQRYLVLAHGLSPEVAQQKLAPVLAQHQTALAALWRGRERRVDNQGEAQRLAAQLQPLLRQVVQQSLAV